MKDRWVWKSRWAAAGAAIAVSIGGGGIFLASAAPGPAESTVAMVAPTRVLDTRDPVNLGLPGPFVSPASQKLQITGAIATSGGAATVVPAGATGVLLNVTAVAPTASGFISIRPGDATGAPTTSSLNVSAGANLPNSVQVALPTAGANAGKIDITYDAYGTAGPSTELLIDVVGYLTNTGLQQLVADVALKANAAAVAALPSSNILAAGTISAAGSKASDAPQIGTVTVSKPGVGLYSLSVPMQCSTSKYPIIMLTLGYNQAQGEIALGSGTCSSNTATFVVNTRDSSGVATDSVWQFMAISGQSQLTIAAIDATDVGANPACVAPTGEVCG